MEAKLNFKPSTIWIKDNLPVMRGMNSNCIDLIYLDPPFNSNADYAAPIGSKAAGAEFKDTWGLNEISLAWHGIIKSENPSLYNLLNATRKIHGDSMMAYLIYMSIRLMEMKRILKPTGSIYLHCDSHASHYLKLLMDDIFGKQNFRNHIIWKRSSSKNDGVIQQFGRVTDHILFYGNPINVDEIQVPLSEEYVATNYNHVDQRGRWQGTDLSGPGTSQGESGMSWKGWNPTDRGRCWSVPKTGKYAKYIESVIPGYLAEESILRRLDLLHEADFIYWTSKGTPRLKRYLQENQGQTPGDIWTDIDALSSHSHEATKYPTQKPVALLERIIRASSNKGDLVLDPFCGCATTLIAAQCNHRNWVGIDISEKASELIDERMRKEHPLMTYKKIRLYVAPTREDLSKIPRYNCTENKQKLYGMQGGYCNGCNTHFKIQHLTVDHIIAQNDGGTHHLSNLQLLCNSCNSIKGDRSHEFLIKCLTDKGWIARKQLKFTVDVDNQE